MKVDICEGCCELLQVFWKKLAYWPEPQAGVTGWRDMLSSKSGFTSRVAPRSRSRPTAGLDWIVDVSAARVQALAGLDRPLAALAVETGERRTGNLLLSHHGTHFPAFSLSQRYILHLLVNLFTSEPQSVELWVEADLMPPHGSSRYLDFGTKMSSYLPKSEVSKGAAFTIPADRTVLFRCVLLPTALRLTCFIATRAPRILYKTEAELRVPPSHANSNRYLKKDHMRECPLHSMCAHEIYVSPYVITLTELYVEMASVPVACLLFSLFGEWTSGEVMTLGVLAARGRLYLRCSVKAPLIWAKSQTWSRMRGLFVLYR
ncbi:hypothetical protein AOLI_G00165960 [Acnodon oligacanthus]